MSHMKRLGETIENVRESLSEYDDLKGLGAMVTLDGVLDLKEDLTINMGASEGFKYSHLTLMIHQGEPLPALYEVRSFESHLTGVAFTVKIMSILGMTWGADGSVVVDVLGTKHIIKAEIELEGELL